MLRPTQVIIDLNCLEHNIASIRHPLNNDTMILAVVKADAYGHGSVQTARRALESGVNWLGVAIPEEGAILRKAGIQAPILVLGGVLPDSIDMLLTYDLTQTVFDTDTLSLLDHHAALIGKNIDIFLKIDTGMNRIGVIGDTDLLQLLDRMHTCSNVSLKGVFTHFAESDGSDKAYSHLQGERFLHSLRLIKEHAEEVIVCAANSGAILDYPEYQFDMVRPGLLLYGYYPSEYVNRDIIHIEPILSWQTQVINVKTLPVGASVSYGRLWTAKRQSTIATLPVGYGDGYKRILTNRGYVLIHGKRAPIVGAVCMDQCMIDVTDVTDVKDVCVGDQAVLLGAQGNDFIGADEMAIWAETISYEILLSISDRVPRIYK